MKPVENIVELDLDLINASSFNPNEMDKVTFDLLVQELKELGCIDPIQVIPNHQGTYTILGGEHRYRAAKELGWKSIPAVLLTGDKWQDEDLQKFVTVRLNVLRGKMNPEKFLRLYDEMVKKYGEDKIAPLMGFTEEQAMQRIVKDAAKAMTASLPSDMSKQFQEKAKKAKTVQDLEHIITHLFEEHGNTMDYSFLVFSWGNKEHIYIAMTKKIHGYMKKLMEFSKSGKIDINKIIGDSIAEAAKSFVVFDEDDGIDE